MDPIATEGPRQSCQHSLNELLSAIDQSETNIRQQIARINTQVNTETGVNNIEIVETLISRVGNNIGRFRSGNARQIITAILDILAGLSAFIPVAGPLFSSVFRLLSLILGSYGDGRNNIGAIVEGVINEALQNYEDSQLSRRAYSTKRTFSVAIAYLSEMDGGSDINPWEIAPMMQLTIFNGVEFLGILGPKLREYTQIEGQHEKTMAFIKLYCELSSFRYSILYQMYCIARSTGHCNYMARSIMSVIDESKQEDASLLRFLSQPDLDNILFFSTVNLFDNRWTTVNEFMTFIGLQFQNLRMLTEGEYQLSPAAWRNKKVVINMLRIVESRTYLRESGTISFTATEEENVFHITTREYPNWKFYMVKDVCGFVRGTPNDKDGAERWKVIRLQDGTYLFSTRKWPNWFMYMVDTRIGWVRGSEGIPPGQQGNWHIERLENPVFDRGWWC